MSPWPVLLSVCGWHSSSTPPCVSHNLLSALHIARCLSRTCPTPRALLIGGSYSSRACDLRVSCPGVSHWLVEVSLCMALSCKAFLLKILVLKMISAGSSSVGCSLLVHHTLHGLALFSLSQKTKVNHTPCSTAKSNALPLTTDLDNSKTHSDCWHAAACSLQVHLTTRILGYRTPQVRGPWA